MRTATAPEQTVLSNDPNAHALKVEIKNAAGSWVDYSAFLAIDWQDRCTITVDVNQRVAEATLELARETEVGSLSPLINTEIKGGRAIRIGGSRVAVGAAASFKPLFLGKIDRIDWKADPMVLVARDDSGLLVDRWIRQNTNYGTEGGRAIEFVMQDILTDWAGGMALYTPVSPGFMVTAYPVDKQPVLQALQTLADWIGWVIEYRWDNGTGAFRLTFYEPDRVPVGTDWTFGPDDYYEVSREDEDTADVRNIITVRYTDAATGAREPYEVTDPASIAAYDEQWAEFEEADDSPINSAAAAQVMGDAALADMAWPVADQEIPVDLFWPVQLGDYYEFLPNGKHYTLAQEFGVTGYTHVFEDGQATTRIRTRGKPVGHTQGWLKRETKPRPPAEVVRSTELLSFREVSRTSTEIKYAWTLGSDLALSIIHDYKEEQPYSSDKWPTEDRVPDSIMDERDAEYTLTIPEQGQVGYFQVEGRLLDGTLGDIERVLVFPTNVAGDYIAFAAVTVDQTDGSVKISGWTADRALSVAYAYNVGAAASTTAPTEAQAKAQGSFESGATGGGLVTGFTSDFEIILPADTVDFGQVIKVLLIAYLNANGTGGDGTASDHGTPVGAQGERFKITVPDQIATGVVIANKLTESSKRFGSDIVWSATDWDTVAWAAGTITMADLTTYAIASGDTGNLATDARRYIYLDPAISLTVLQVTTAIATATGENKVLLCEAARASGGAASGQFAHFVPAVGAFFLNADQVSAEAITAIKVATGAITTVKITDDAITAPKILAGAITTAKLDALAVTADKIAANAIIATKISAGAVETDKLAANSVTAAKISVSALSAISADLGTVTAGTISSGIIVASDSFTAPEMKVYGGAINPVVKINNTSGLLITDGGLNFHQIYFDGSNNMLIQAAAGVSVRINDTVIIEGDIDHNGTNVGFYGTAPAAKPTVTGSRGGNAALASLLTALAGLGLLVDSSS